MSEKAMETPQIYGLISKVMADIGAIGKDSKNEAQGYKFRGIEAFYNAAHPALVKHGVFCCPQVIDCESTDRMSGTGKPAIRVTMRISHKFYAPDGSFVDVITCGEGIDSSDKATNKATSAAMKYALIELFSVPTMDMEDSDRNDPEAGLKKSTNVERTTEPTPLAAKPANGKTNGDHILPPAADLITVEQAQRLHMRFRDALPEDMQSKSDDLLRDFLGRKLILDKDGNPSAKGIRKDEYAKLGPEAIAFAKELGQ